MPKTKHPSPEPVVVTTVCSMCGLDWERHGAEPTTEDCIRLLKAELARKPVTTPAPWMEPRPIPFRPWWPGPVWYYQPSTSTRSTNGVYQTRTPALSTSTLTARAI